MGIGLYLQPKLLRTGIAAPALSVSQEELLPRSVAVLSGREVDVFPLRIREKRDVGQTQAAVVGGVLAQRQFAVHLHVIDGDEAVVFLHFAVGLFLKVFGILGGPPVGEISVAVELTAFIIEAVGEFVSHDAANVAIV